MDSALQEVLNMALLMYALAKLGEYKVIVIYVTYLLEKLLY